ncbi:MAG: ABC transporter ATP-binding protein, partial [Bacteroidia bacterium]|nr:ABC transporter ATP-binding protein [Bacteroidia bacterium]
MTDKSLNKVLSVVDLSIGYKSKSTYMEVCKQVNFDLYAGELIGLVGPNGIGKSTLIRTICKVQPELGGSVLINRKDLKTYSQVDLARVLSLVLTDPLVTQSLSVWEIVALGRQPYTNWIGKITPKDKERINSAIEITNISKFLDKKAFELSDGQLQKVMIARALAQDT